MTTNLGFAGNIPLSAPSPVVSFSPVVLPVAGRAVALELRVSAPLTGRGLPVILLSHGHGRSNHLSSLNGYAPLANFWAAHGFVVVQPTHLSSKTLSLDGPDAPLFWRSRVDDMSQIIDQMEVIEAAVPLLAGRIDTSRIAVAGHSMGGHTASMLLGMRLIDPTSETEVDVREPRITAGVLLAAPGSGGAALSAFAAEHYSFFSRPSFTAMTTPTLVVVGDADVSPHLTVRGAEWHADAYRLSTSPKSLLTLFGGEHGLGGVSGYDVAETTDENPERVALVQRLTWAYLRTALKIDDTTWSTASAAMQHAGAPGRIESR
ncbi:MAG: chlorophyllase [Gemmatimonadaceae bacterium]|nr:chlorophyllase [Gemmatimonadaceae bacterium]